MRSKKKKMNMSTKQSVVMCRQKTITIIPLSIIFSMNSLNWKEPKSNFFIFSSFVRCSFERWMPFLDSEWKREQKQINHPNNITESPKITHKRYVTVCDIKSWLTNRYETNTSHPHDICGDVRRCLYSVTLLVVSFSTVKVSYIQTHLRDLTKKKRKAK